MQQQRLRASNMKVRVISMTGSVERRRLVKETLSDMPLPWAFFDGLTASDPCGIEADPKRQIIRSGRTLRPGEIGTMKSHYGVLAEFDRDPDLRWLLVLEDDVLVDPNFDFLGAAMLAEQYGIHRLSLYAMHWKPADAIACWADRQLLRFRSMPYGGQCR